MQFAQWMQGIVESHLYAVPFGNVVACGSAVYLGYFDVVNGGYSGKVFNWSAMICATGVDHAYVNYLSSCR